MSLAFGATRPGWWMNGKALKILNTRRLSELSRILAAKHSCVWTSLTDNGVQTFQEGEENQYTKRKTESYVFSGFGVSISLGWEWGSTTERFATNRFWPSTWKASSVGKDKVNKWEFCKLKITTIEVFVIMMQRIFSSWEFAPTHSTIVIRGLSIHSFSLIDEVGFSCE